MFLYACNNKLHCVVQLENRYTFENLIFEWNTLNSFGRWFVYRIAFVAYHNNVRHKISHIHERNRHTAFGELILMLKSSIYFNMIFCRVVLWGTHAALLRIEFCVIEVVACFYFLFFS